MRISDWSSDVCSSDLSPTGEGLVAALALGAQGIHCGTAFLATQESFAHDYHKERLVSAPGEATVHTDAFAINWPPASAVRVIANSLTDSLGRQLYGHDPAALPPDAGPPPRGPPTHRSPPGRGRGG